MAARGRRLGRRGAGAARARDDTAHLRGAGVDRAARGDRRERSRGVVLRARLPGRWPPGDRVRARPRRPDAAARPRGREPRAAHRSRVELLLRRGRRRHVLRRQALHPQPSRRAVRGVLETLVAHGAPPEILASWRPHIGSNRLPRVVEAMRETIRRSAGAVRFGTRVDAIETSRDASRPHVEAVLARDLDAGVWSASPAMRSCWRPDTAPSTPSRWRHAPERGSSPRVSPWACVSSIHSPGSTPGSTAVCARDATCRPRSTSWRRRWTRAASTASACVRAAGWSPPAPDRHGWW